MTIDLGVGVGMSREEAVGIRVLNVLVRERHGGRRG
jgi:hypothetical protein